jgi:hypothetical protein
MDIDDSFFGNFLAPFRSEGLTCGEYIMLCENPRYILNRPQAEQPPFSLSFLWKKKRLRGFRLNRRRYLLPRASFRAKTPANDVEGDPETIHREIYTANAGPTDCGDTRTGLSTAVSEDPTHCRLGLLTPDPQEVDWKIIFEDLFHKNQLPMYQIPTDLLASNSTLITFFNDILFKTLFKKKDITIEKMTADREKYQTIALRSKRYYQNVKKVMVQMKALMLGDLGEKLRYNSTDRNKKGGRKAKKKTAEEELRKKFDITTEKDQNLSKTLFGSDTKDGLKTETKLLLFTNNILFDNHIASIGHWMRVVKGLQEKTDCEIKKLLENIGPALKLPVRMEVLRNELEEESSQYGRIREEEGESNQKDLQKAMIEKEEKAKRRKTQAVKKAKAEGPAQKEAKRRKTQAVKKAKAEGPAQKEAKRRKTQAVKKAKAEGPAQKEAKRRKTQAVKKAKAEGPAQKEAKRRKTQAVKKAKAERANPKAPKTEKPESVKTTKASEKGSKKASNCKTMPWSYLDNWKAVLSFLYPFQMIKESDIPETKMTSEVFRDKMKRLKELIEYFEKKIEEECRGQILPEKEEQMEEKEEQMEEKEEQMEEKEEQMEEKEEQRMVGKYQSFVRVIWTRPQENN